ncbi:MAG TPA: permease prefix domain 1-containing protein, partial [Blastocatellia bacterium]|nr:permease prefix domain 1-containing protein [Blastocatellia bacterium]
MKLFGRRKRKEEELDAEIQSHLDQATRDRVERGETAEQARAHARREFGNVALVKEVTREVWGWTPLERLLLDLRFGLRMLRKAPNITLIAVLTLALGIGANTAMFSAVDAVLIRPLPYVDAGRLVMIWDEMSHIGFPKHQSTPAEWREWRQHNTVFTDLAATQPVRAILSSDGEPAEAPAR